MAERIELMVTVKAYPNISQKYGEVVCVAGICTDRERPEWVRLFPVPFRDLELQDQFAKYQVISLEADLHSGDSRPESRRPNVDTLQLHQKITTSGKWKKRRELVEPMLVESMCELRRRQEKDGVSLGVFKPADVEEFTWDQEEAEWSPEKKGIISQPSLLLPTKTGLEKIPYRFRYRYRCSDSKCNGHHQSIIDWELAALYRKAQWLYDTEEVRLEKIAQKWLDEMCGPKKDTHFFVGNQHQYPEGFLVLGVFWPPKGED
jgi:hypothetical protein